MVYKRYIKRGNKVYGPYIYYSKKEGGKVISTYLGKHSEKKPRKNFKPFLKFFAIGVVGVFFLLTVFLLFFNMNLTGKITLSLEDTYVFDEQILGSVKINLEQGELIPASTKVIIEFDDVSYEYLLSDLVSEDTIEGDFYVEGKDIFGTGEGYDGGLVYPIVYFSLDVYSEEEPEEIVKELEEEVGEIEKIDKIINETEIVEEEVTPPIPPQDTVINQTIEEIIEEVEESEEIEFEKEIVEQEAEETGEIEELEQESEEETLITGNIIKEFFGKLTGEAILSAEIKGEVSFDKPFVYNLTEGQTAKVVLSSQDVELIVEDGRVTVTTDFVGEGKGILIDLSELNIPVSEGELKISLFYNNTKLVSASEVLEVEEIEEVVNVTDVVFEPININTTQYGAVINQPVKWKKNVKLDKKGLVKVELPKGADKISVYKIVDEEAEEIEEETPPTFPQDNVTNPQDIVTNQTNTSQDIVTNQTTEEIINETKIVETTPPNQIINKTKEKVSDNKIKIAKVTGKVFLEIDLDKKSKVGFFKKLFSRLTGRVVGVEEKEEFVEVLIDDNATEFEIEYETPGPVVFEDVSGSVKEIVVSSEVHYENILAYTELPREVVLDEIKFYHVVNGSRVAVDFIAYDVYGEVVEEDLTPALSEGNEINQTNPFQDEIINENRTVIYSERTNETINETEFSIQDIVNETDSFTSQDTEIEQTLVNYITWVVPHLSNQTYLLIIEVVGAEHLDEDRNFVSDIYDEVKALDGNWSEVIDENHYVRVVFEQELDSSRDITVFARADKKVDLEVYAEDCEGVVLIDGNNVSKEIYAKKKRIDEIRRLLNE